MTHISKQGAHLVDEGKTNMKKTELLMRNQRINLPEYFRRSQQHRKCMIQDQ